MNSIFLTTVLPLYWVFWEINEKENIQKIEVEEAVFFDDEQQIKRPHNSWTKPSLDRNTVQVCYKETAQHKKVICHMAY